MKFEQFISIYREVLYIDAATFSLYASTRNLRRQVVDWVKQGYMLPLKKGLYVFSESFRKRLPSIYAIANALSCPSYISLQSALDFYSIIPEKVVSVISVCPRKTNFFKNAFGQFEYRRVKKKLFFGFKKLKVGEEEITMADPEKALLDYFYFTKNFTGEQAEIESLRLQNMEVLQEETLLAYAEQYPVRVKKIAAAIIQYRQLVKKNYRTI